jgi:hypothetical protein
LMQREEQRLRGTLSVLNLLNWHTGNGPYRRRR